MAHLEVLVGIDYAYVELIVSFVILWLRIMLCNSHPFGVDLYLFYLSAGLPVGCSMDGYRQAYVFVFWEVPMFF